jgi:hypothetical protein
MNAVCKHVILPVSLIPIVRGFNHSENYKKENRLHAVCCHATNGKTTGFNCYLHHQFLSRL